MADTVALEPGPRPSEHVGRDVYGDDVAVGRVLKGAQPGPHADLEDRFAGGGRQPLHGMAPAGRQRHAVDQIVDWRKFLIESLDAS